MHVGSSKFKKNADFATCLAVEMGPQ